MLLIKSSWPLKYEVVLFLLLVSGPDSGSGGLGFNVLHWAKFFTLTVPMSTQEYKWCTGEFSGKLD